MILWSAPFLWRIPTNASEPYERVGSLASGPGGGSHPGDVVRPGLRRSSEIAGPYDLQDRRGGAVEPPPPEEISRTAAPPELSDRGHPSTPPAHLATFHPGVILRLFADPERGQPQDHARRGTPLPYLALELPPDPTRWIRTSPPRRPS